MTQPGIVRVTTRRSVVRTPRTQATSLLPLLVPVSIAAAAFVGKLFTRKKPLESGVRIETRVEVIALFWSEE